MSIRIEADESGAHITDVTDGASLTRLLDDIVRLANTQPVYRLTTFDAERLEEAARVIRHRMEQARETEV